MAALALYRTYRPGTLAEVIGQDHVTQPLSRALTSGRIHHAYLFSGPRGCGKTSTARILARSLNCESGPTPSPCGQCQSCVDLAPNGPGSLDVVELDAATHRGIDDAKDLRERAIYAPAFSQFRVYILDEAHQLTPEAANALLKLIEEPPAHLRFIFATTEPDRIIPTIRSRTFHYGFRLVPGRILVPHLASVCQREGIPAEPAALAAVARAGGGSVRDSLSLLGQLLAGAGPEGLTLAEASRALGLTDGAIVDDFVGAVAARSAADMFDIVDRVVSAGHDPRRFAGELLDRMRDLIVLRADPDAIAHGLLDIAAEASDRMMAQAEALGPARLSRVADQLSAGLSELKGATAPRLQLELLCARLALPDAAGDGAGLVARVEALERGLAQGGLRPEVRGSTTPGQAAAGVVHQGGPGSADRVAAEPDPVAAPAGTPASRLAGEREPAPAIPRAPVLRTTRRVPPPLEAPAVPAPAGERPDRRGDRAGATQGGGGTAPSPLGADASSSPAPVARPVAAATGRDVGKEGPVLPLDQVRGRWAEVLDRLAESSRVAWTLFHDAVPLSVDDGVLCLAVSKSGNVMAISGKGHDERLRQVLIDLLGIDVRISAVHDPGAAGPSAARGSTVRDAPAPPSRPAAAPTSSGRAGRARSQAPDGGAGGPVGAAGGPATGPGAHSEAVLRGPRSIPGSASDDEASIDDPDVPSDSRDGLAFITRELGARPIGEIDHS